MAGGPYKTASGWYFITWTQGGRQVKEALKTKNLQEARRRKQQLEAEHFNGTHDPFRRKWYERPTPATSLPEIAKEYIEFKKTQRGRKGWKTPGTVKSHSKVIDSLVDHLKTTEAITEENLDRFLHRKEIKSDHTRVSYKRRIDAFLHWCAQKGYIQSAPEVEVDLPQIGLKEYVPDKKLREIFARMDEVARMPARHRYDSKHAGFAWETQWFADFCRVAVGTGLRPGELTKLKITDINGSDIHVGKSFRVKTNFARKVPIDDPICIDVISQYLDPDFRKPDPVLSRTDLLFGRTHLGNLNRDLKQACEDVKSPVILTAKELRHLFAIRFLLRRKDDELKIPRLMQVMGHRKLSTTQGYLSYLPSDSKL